MNCAAQAPEGIRIRMPAGTEAESRRFEQAFDLHLAAMGTRDWCETRLERDGIGLWLTATLKPSIFAELCPGFDTLGLEQALRRRDAGSSVGADALMREAWVALLCAPERIAFESLEQLASHLRVRCNIARAAAKTALAFKTEAAQRPAEHWHEKEGEGFLLKPHACLIEALVTATQPERSGQLYDFSCYRATEYVILLGIAQEAREHAPDLYARLQARARERCIKSGRFHDVFLVEYGSLEAPLPMDFYMPGDRLWFKNPDEPSSDALGYEGSWVIYLGGGLFSNFWNRDRPYSIESKCLEIYHWRDGACRDAQAQVQIDEAAVDAAVSRTRRDPQRLGEVLARMRRYRDPSGIYRNGGCIDASREFPRHLSQIHLLAD